MIDQLSHTNLFQVFAKEACPSLMADYQCNESLKQVLQCWQCCVRLGGMAIKTPQKRHCFRHRGFLHRDDRLSMGAEPKALEEFPVHRDTMPSGQLSLL